MPPTPLKTFAPPHFGKAFDGYCVIHSPTLSPERRPSFERELARVGIADYQIIEPEKVLRTDPRLKKFKRSKNPRATLSLILTHIQCLEHARTKGWNTLAVFEDDILFRDNFGELWAEVESEVLQFHWDLLYLYHWYARQREGAQPVQLKKINDTLCTHGYIARRAAYEAMRKSLLQLIEEGFAVDNWHFHHRLIKEGFTVVATTRNLAGQAPSTRSFVSNAVRTRFVEDTFNIWNPNPLGTVAWFVTKAAMMLAARLRRLF